MKRRRLLVLLAAGCTVVVLWAMLNGRGQRVTLADGSTLTVHAVTVGLSNRYCFGNAAYRIAAKLPWPWAQRFAASRLLTVPPDRDTNLVVWVTYRGSAPRAGRFRFRCVHDGGTNDLVFSCITKYLPSGEAAASFNTAFWPRRSKRFMLQALDAEPLWEIRVPNPLSSDPPQWQPEVLPGRRTVDDVSFILEEIVPSESQPATTATGFPLDAEALQALLHVTRDGQPDDGWEICGTRFRDPLGNVQQQFRQSQTRNPGGRFGLDFVLSLLAGERAGKLGVAFVRTKEFASNELFTLPEMDLPAPGKHITQSLRTNAQWGEIRLSVIAHNLNSGPEFEVSALRGLPPGREPTGPGARWLQPFSATDDRGRHYSFTATDDRRSVISVGDSFRRIRVPRDAKALVVTVAVPLVVFVEYSVGRESITRSK